MPAASRAVVISAGTGLTDYNLRGFTSSEYFRNGFPVNRGCPSVRASIAIERVDVLRGHAVLLYGRVDPGGIFNMGPRRPSATTTQTVSARVESFGAWRGSVDATEPVDAAQTVHYRIGAAVEGGDTFREYVKSDRIVVAPVVACDATPDLTLTLGSEFVQVKSRSIAAIQGVINDFVNDPDATETKAAALTWCAVYNGPSDNPVKYRNVEHTATFSFTLAHKLE